MQKTIMLNRRVLVFVPAFLLPLAANASDFSAITDMIFWSVMATLSLGLLLGLVTKKYLDAKDRKTLYLFWLLLLLVLTSISVSIWMGFIFDVKFIYGIFIPIVIYSLIFLAVWEPDNKQ